MSGEGSAVDYEALRREVGGALLDQASALAAMSPEELDRARAELIAAEDYPTPKNLLTWHRKHLQKKANLDSIRKQIANQGFSIGLDDDSVERIADAGFRGKNLALALVATEIACDEHPITLRGLFYRIVSAGFLPSTDKVHYTRTGRVMTALREKGIVPFHWLVDNVRSSLKPSSWSGIEEFVETVQRAYRKDFWAQLPSYVHVIVEKDAMAGVVQPVTREFDVTLSPIRGYASLSFAHEIASTWNRIEKPIYVYYLGDFDPSGFDLERDIKEKLHRYCHRGFRWRRLGVNARDFDDFDLLKLEPKATDKRYQKFVAEHGTACAELDAVPASEIRRRVQEAIESHIPADQWARLQDIENTERSLFNETLGRLRSEGTD